MVDLLGLDKLASSMALSMCAQAAGILLGPTISGKIRNGGSVVVDSLFVWEGWSLFSYDKLNVLSSFAIISLRKLVA